VAVYPLRRVPPITSALIGLTLGMSVVAVIDARMGGRLLWHLALIPEAVWRGQIWRLVTWPFILGGPLALIFTCIALYTFGTDLLIQWGGRRYLRYLGGVVLVAGVGTCLAALALPGAWEMPQLGGMVLIDAIVIAWARQFPDSPVQVYFVLLLHGRALVTFTVAVTLLFAVYFGLAWALPELLAIAAALLYMHRTPRRLWLRLKLAWVRRRLSAI